MSGKKQDRRPPRRHERIPERETKREYYREQLAALAEPGFLAGVKGEMERVNLDLERVEQEVKRIAREKEKVLEQFSGQISNEVITIQPITKGSPGFAENLARCCIVMELFPTLPSVQKAVREFVNANLRDNQSKIRPETKIHGTIAMSQKLPGYEFYWTQDRTSDRLRISLTQFLSLSQTNSR